MLESTMMTGNLTTALLLRHGLDTYMDSVVVSLTATGKEQSTFAELGDRVIRLASGLAELGVVRGDRVGTFQWNNGAHLEAYLAVPSMGSVLHTVNVRLPAEQIVYVINDAEDAVLIVDESLFGLLDPLASQLPLVRHVIVVGHAPTDSQFEAVGAAVLGYEELLDRTVPNESLVDGSGIDETDAAAMCYTSGTTGVPKGVVYSHRSTYLHAMAVCTGSFLGLTERDRVLSIVPMFHANAWGLPYAGWMSGCDLLLPDRFMQASRLCEFIATEKATISAGVPTIWADVLRYAATETVDLSSLRLIGGGGSAIPESMIRGFDEKFGLELIQGFGMTETSPMVAIGRVPKNSRDHDEWFWRAKTGRIMAGVECRITGEDGSALPRDGESIGEIELRGPWITGSYHRGAGSDSFHDGWLRTGDIGSIDARGYIKISDRSKDVIKSGGEWISSVDLENELSAHPHVAEAAVIAVPDDRWQERPLAVVVRTEGSMVTDSELGAHLGIRFAQWQIPDHWVFIDAIPRTSVGKFDKKMLRERHSRAELVES